jgi:RNA polymerase sigma-70 factor (ECF subfamily)
MVASVNEWDARLVQGIAGGDRNALAELYHRYAPSLLGIGVRILGERREAEDLLHDVFLEVWRAAADYDVARGTVRAWLVMRMRSRSLDRRKSAGFSRVVSLEERRVPDEAPAGEDPALARDRVAVRRALAELSAEQRQVLELGYFEGLSSSEIAERIRTPIGTVKSRVAAALGKLRAVLGQEQVK